MVASPDEVAVVVVLVVEEVVEAAEKVVADRKAFSFSAVAPLRPCFSERGRLRLSNCRVPCYIYL